jgi:hypothetical protein
MGASLSIVAAILFATIGGWLAITLVSGDRKPGHCRNGTPGCQGLQNVADACDECMWDSHI